MTTKSIDELKAILSKSEGENIAEEVEIEEKAIKDKEEEDEEKEKKECPSEKSLTEEVEIIEVDVSKSLKGMFDTYFGGVAKVLEDLDKSISAVNEENKANFEGLAKSLKEIVEDGSKLKKSLESLEERVKKLEETPNTRKSITSDVEVKERFEKSEGEVDINVIGDKLVELAMQGRIPPTEVAKFEVKKSLDVLNKGTKHLLGIA